MNGIRNRKLNDTQIQVGENETQNQKCKFNGNTVTTHDTEKVPYNVKKTKTVELSTNNLFKRVADIGYKTASFIFPVPTFLINGFSFYGPYLAGFNSREVKNLTAKGVWENLKCPSLREAFEIGKAVLWRARYAAFIGGVIGMEAFRSYVLAGFHDSRYEALMNTLAASKVTEELFQAVYMPFAKILGGVIATQITAYTLKSIFATLFANNISKDLCKEWLESGACYGMKLDNKKSKEKKINVAHVISQDVASWVKGTSHLLMDWISATAAFSLALKTIVENLSFEILKNCLIALMVVKISVYICNYFIQILFAKIASKQDELHSKLHEVDKAAESILMKKGASYEADAISQHLDNLNYWDTMRSTVGWAQDFITTLFRVGGWALGIYLCKDQLIAGGITSGAAQVIGWRVYDLFNFVCWMENNAKSISGNNIDIKRMQTLDQWIQSWERKQREKSNHFTIERRKEIAFSFNGEIGKIENDEEIFGKGKIELKAGDICHLDGKSGTGKSTTIRAIANLYPAVKGKMVTPENIRIVPQVSYVPSGKMKLLDIIQYPDTGSVDEKKRNKIKKLLEEFGFEEKRFIENLENANTDWSKELSGGERQRLALITEILALEEKPGMLILDEATSAIDKDTKETIEQYMKEHLQKSIILFVDHNHSGKFANKKIQMGKEFRVEEMKY